MKKLFSLLVAIFICLSAYAENSASDNHAVILIYHHVSESGPETTSVTPKRFREHLQYLKDNNYEVWPLQKVLDTIFSNEAMPDKVVTITFDDAYRSVYTNALPLLKEFNYPFTFFVDTKAVVEKHTSANPLRPSWDELKTLKDNGGTIANHSHSHAHLPNRLKNETDAEWEKRIRLEITTAQTLLKERLGDVPNWFAYPFGEYDDKTQAIIADLKLWGFGQHSGPIGPLSDKLALPRFAVAGQYSAIPSFKQKVATKPFPVTRLDTPKQTFSADKSAPIANVELRPGSYTLKNLNCFSHGGERAEVTLSSAHQFAVQAKRKLAKGRSRYNCTLADGNGGLYWLSIPWLVQ